MLRQRKLPKTPEQNEVCSTTDKTKEIAIQTNNDNQTIPTELLLYIIDKENPFTKIRLAGTNKYYRQYVEEKYGQGLINFQIQENYRRNQHNFLPLAISKLEVCSEPLLNYTSQPANKNQMSWLTTGLCCITGTICSPILFAPQTVAIAYCTVITGAAIGSTAGKKAADTLTDQHLNDTIKNTKINLAQSGVILFAKKTNIPTIAHDHSCPEPISMSRS